MEKHILPIFQGVALAAQHTMKPTVAATLQRDTLKLTQECLPRQGFQIEGRTGMINKIALVDAWLDYRQKQPFSESIECPYMEAIPGVELASRFLQMDKAAKFIVDDPFIELFAGSQIGLKRFKPDIPEDILKQDWDEIGEAYQHLVKFYDNNKVPADGVYLLAVNEVIHARSNNPLEPLRKLIEFIIKEPRFGLLEIRTRPTGAYIRVDNEEWGLSPEQRGIHSGRHNVKAERNQLRAEQNVKVEPAKCNSVDLILKVKR